MISVLSAAAAGQVSAYGSCHNKEGTATTVLQITEIKYSIASMYKKDNNRHPHQ
jgi:hypothetical protein